MRKKLEAALARHEMESAFASQEREGETPAALPALDLQQVQARIRQKMEKEGRDLPPAPYNEEVGGDGSIEALPFPAPAADGDWELKRLKGRHYRILTLHALGLKNIEIAEQLNCTPQTVSNTLNAPIAQPILQELYEQLQSPVADVSAVLAQSMGGILEELLRMMHKPGVPESVKARIGLGLMDRAGHGPVRTNINHNSTLTADDIEELKSRARAARMSIESEKGPEVEEATFEDITPNQAGEGQ